MIHVIDSPAMAWESSIEATFLIEFFIMVWAELAP
jgi:hypothetical protein